MKKLIVLAIVSIVLFTSCTKTNLPHPAPTTSPNNESRTELNIPDRSNAPVHYNKPQ